MRSISALWAPNEYMVMIIIGEIKPCTHTISKSTYDFDLKFLKRDDNDKDDNSNDDDDDGNDDDGYVMLHWCWLVDFIHLAQHSGTKCKTQHDTIKYYR